ncbi:hypothetical protein [Pseudoruegeria sp. SK021]|uniref:hypothetical protein n=1 Tax=Pseudoruegeria sp. SK021 TaxID=1933035 RepID=UPI00111C66A8|nr:hypothetical protein [Pseudoruegeria sp. SK021]
MSDAAKPAKFRRPAPGFSLHLNDAPAGSKPPGNLSVLVPNPGKHCAGKAADVMGLFSQLGNAVSQIFDNDDDMRLIRDAGTGSPVNNDKLAAAYWRKYFGTYQETELWRTMSRAQRDAVYRRRLKLKVAFSQFSALQKEWVTELQPPKPDDWPPKRLPASEWD